MSDYWIIGLVTSHESFVSDEAITFLPIDWFVSLLLHTIANFGQLAMEAAMSHSFKDWFCWKVPADQILGSKVASSFSTIFLTRIATFHLHVILTSVSLVSPRIAINQ